MSRYDVIILGGGPAGSATAIICAQHGLQVALLERDKFPRNRPGETLHPGVEPLLGQLGVLEEILNADFIRELRVVQAKAQRRDAASRQGGSGETYRVRAAPLAIHVERK